MILLIASRRLLLALHLIFVHGVDGQEIEVNVEQISTIREPRDTEGHFAKEIQCLLFMTSGKFVAITESCQTVVTKIKES
jgi:uncharacterized protein YlzI (FlbEa/FlbD family)